ncbi:MAG TPA: hypothetical protein VK110_08835 [Salinisphaeraceae bacterium]|nr:hypothetical protein [Salinisphaeraceae bacterium]
MHKLNLLLTLGLLTMACAVQADTRLSYVDQQGQTTTVSIRAGAIRIDAGDGTWQLYQQRSDTLYTLDPASKSYTRMNPERAATLRRRMAQVQRDIERQLEKLPARKRAAARAALAEQLPGFDDDTWAVSLATGQGTDRVAGVECKIVQVLRGDTPAASLCVASAEALALTSAESATLQSMFALMDGMLAGTAFAAASLPYTELAGMPIRYRSADHSNERRLTQVAHGALDDALFALPPGFQEQVMDDLPQN